VGLFGRRAKPKHEVVARLDREGTKEDLASLNAFVTSRHGVELYLEPETAATDTTLVAVAADGEWIRRRVGNAATAFKFAQDRRLPLYEAVRVGYPQRMRDWTSAHPERRMR
jgi:hypothetical protein